jgi:hypothetical protein
MEIKRGDLVVPHDNSLPWLLRVERVSLETTSYLDSSRTQHVFSAVRMEHGHSAPVDLLIPLADYRHATHQEIAAARELGMVPPPLLN